MKGLTQEQRKKLREQIVEYRKAGHYVRECCEHFGVKRSYVYSACRGIAYQWEYDIDTMRQAAIEQNKDNKPDESYAIKMIAERAPQFEYVSGYINIDNPVVLKCKTCSAIFRRSFCSVRHGSVQCPECYKHEIERRGKEKEQERREREREREQKRFERFRSKQRQLVMKECGCCGELFINNGKRTKFCSDECMIRAGNAQSKDRRIKKIQVVKRDNIILSRLYERDNGVCHICGSLCNWNDYEVREDGTFVAGNDYPSIDHVIPLSKGGQHSWNNVKLAHRICNTLKSDQIDSSLQILA